MRLPRFSYRSVPAALLGVVVLTYGIFIPWFGFYGDDWIYIYNHYLLGAKSFIDFVAIDRPFSAWIYLISTPIFGDAVWPYHVFLLVLRWLSAALLWWVLQMVWPERKREITWVAFLFAIYPGFQQQPIAVQYILHFGTLDLFLFSLGTMLLSVMDLRRSWLWLSLALVSSLSIFGLEYFAGLEILRPIFLWIVLSRLMMEKKTRLKKFAGVWAPFLLVAGGFGFWRVFIFKFPTYQPDMVNGLISSPKTAVLELAKRVLTDIKITTYSAWRQTFSLPAAREQWLLFIVIVVVGFILVWLYFSALEKGEQSTAHMNSKAHWWREWPVLWILIGGLTMLAAGLPFWAAGVRLELAFPWDRSTLPFMTGACLMLAALLVWILRPGAQILAVALLIGLSMGLHFQNAKIYQVEWDHLRTYFWQMSWRAPALQEGTVLVSDDIPLYRYSDNDLTPVVNWMYAPKVHQARIPYKYFDLSTRVGSALPGIAENLPIKHSYRNHQFASNTSSVLAIYYQTGSCMWFLGPQDGDFPHLPERIREVLPISHLDMVENNNTQTFMPAMLGPEPEHDWCYFFEKADLAAQFENWQTAAQLGDEAFEKGFEAVNAIEYLPFFEGYLQTGNQEKSRELAGKITQDEAARPLLCARLKTLQKSTQADTAKKNLISAIRLETGCE